MLKLSKHIILVRKLHTYKILYTIQKWWLLHIVMHPVNGYFEIDFQKFKFDIILRKSFNEPYVPSSSFPSDDDILLLFGVAGRGKDNGTGSSSGITEWWVINALREENSFVKPCTNKKKLMFTHMHRKVERAHLYFVSSHSSQDEIVCYFGCRWWDSQR